MVMSLQQSGSGGSRAGSTGAGGAQAVAMVGNGPTGAPLVGNDVPDVVTPVHAVRTIVPCCEVGTPAELPTGRTSPTPPTQLSGAEYERALMSPPARVEPLVAPEASITALSSVTLFFAATLTAPP